MDSLALPSDGVQSQELKQWLLRLKYSFILRQRRVGKSTRRRPQRHSAFISNRCLHLNVLLGLAASAYFLSSKNPTLDQLIQESGLQSVDQIFSDQSRSEKTLKANVIKSVLRQRGVFSESALERKDLEALAARSGDISRQEALSALSADARLQQFNSSCDPDSRLYYDQFLSPTTSTPSFPSVTSLPPVCASQSSFPPKTVIFDSVTLFVERIEDNKQSIWILSVKNSTLTRHCSTSLMHGRKRTKCSKTGEISTPVTPTTWGHLVRRFKAFDVRFGILLCDKLDDICKAHGFSTSHLILALPNSIGNGRHAVEFRRFNFPNLMPTTVCNDLSTEGRRVCIGQADQVSRWLEGVLSERVSLLTSPNQLLPKYANPLSTEWTFWPDFMWQKPQPLHLVWVPGVRLLNRTYPVNGEQHSIEFRPPMAFSALAVPHMERSRLWRLDSHDMSFSEDKSPFHEDWPLSNHVAPHSQVLAQLGCSHTNLSGHAAFVLITPEGTCQLLIPSLSDKMHLAYSHMNALLHWNFPSTNDVFIAGLVILNFVFVLRSFLSLVIFLLHSKLVHNFSQHVGALIPCRLLAKKPKACKMMSTAMRTRVCLILNVVQTTFAGWSNYTPTKIALPTSQVMQPAENLSSFTSLICLWVNASVLLVFQLFMANLLFLLAALPVINIMGRALPLVSVLLRLLRGFVSSFGVYSLCIEFSLYCLAHITLCTIIASLAINIVCTFLVCKLLGVFLKYRSAIHFSDSQQRTPYAPCLAKLFRMNYISAALNSPASLARYLVLSDTEFTNEPPSSPGSSDTDLSSGTPGLCMSSLGSVRVSETARLYKKVMELERAVTGSSGHILDAADTEQILHLLRSQSTTTNRRSNGQSNTLNPSEPPAKIYSWKFSGVETTDQPARRGRICGSPRQDYIEELSFPSFQPQNPLSEDERYDAESETDEAAVAGTSRKVVRHRRRNQNGGRQCQSSPFSSSSSSIDDDCRLPVHELGTDKSDSPLHIMVGWPSWVVPCDCCVVCWREFEIDNDLAALVCGHAFHSPCVKQWLDMGRLICPVCRWPANVSHQQRERQLIGQLVKSLRSCARVPRHSSVSSNLSVPL
ncbi:unnamed protein product [Schistocephalus solidus]|uniref:RING-type domain-containing protein n=2 Tax=Schistocephalus solidus TaxID=70667 RepID=A0A0X3NWP9_SCHSO|nr:unnamed protein product [Schistocephalus solidus]